MSKNEVYFMTVSDGVITKEIPCYTCGHCTSPIALRTDRIRPRTTCLSCGRWICEKSEICNSQCTPMYSLADDHFENSGQYGRYVRAIMRGATTIEEAEKAGLITGV